MAQAIIRGLVSAGHAPESISVADPAQAQLDAVATINAAINVTSDNTRIAQTCDVIILAVKPQIMADIAKQLARLTRPPGQIIISVAAGITLDSLCGWFGADARVVRVMPNQPALIAEGMSGLCATAAVEPAHRATADYLLAATGKTAWFEDESLIDAVTAVSGSGPAYFYLIMEIMQDIAGEFGFDAETARILATQTALGAASVATQSNENLASLRERVTSPGGTTAAALKSLETSGIRDIFRKALLAARDRSIELGQPGKDE